MNFTQRKQNRLENFDYGQKGAYFITICVKDRNKILSNIVGTASSTVPTDTNFKIDNKNSPVAKFISTFKRFCNKEYGENIWQSRYYDYIIRNQEDYNETWEYIDNNPQKWILKKETQDR